MSDGDCASRRPRCRAQIARPRWRRRRFSARTNMPNRNTSVPMSTTAARRTNVPEFSTAYYLLEGLKETGIDYLFCNFGTDHAPIIDEMARRKTRRADAERGALSAREHRSPHGRGLCARHRPRPGRAGPCRCRHRQHRKRHAQYFPQPPAGAADGRQSALHRQQRAGRIRATPTCISFRSRSTRQAWCGPI